MKNFLALAPLYASVLVLGCATPAGEEAPLDTGPNEHAAEEHAAATGQAGTDQELPVFEIVYVEHADAGAMADTLNDFILDASAPVPAAEIETKVMADPRTNSLVIMADPERLPELLALIAQLDKAGTE